MPCLANLTPSYSHKLVGRGGSRRSRPEEDDQEDIQQHHNDGPIMKEYEPVSVGAQVVEPLPSVRGMRVFNVCYSWRPTQLTAASKCCFFFY